MKTGVLRGQDGATVTGEGVRKLATLVLMIGIFDADVGT